MSGRDSKTVADLAEKVQSRLEAAARQVDGAAGGRGCAAHPHLMELCRAIAEGVSLLLLAKIAGIEESAAQPAVRREGWRLAFEVGLFLAAVVSAAAAWLATGGAVK